MCVSAVIRLDLNLLLTFKLTKTNTDEQQMPHVLFLHTIDSWPHLSSRVARLRTNKKVKGNLGRFGSHGFGMPLEVPNLTDLWVHLAHLQEKATRQKTQIVGYGMLPHI